MKTDHLFYRLFRTLPRLFFELVGQPAGLGELYRFHSVAVKQTALTLDGLFAPPAERTDLPLYFIEVQFQRDDTLYPRLFSEIFLYLKQYRPPHPWQAVVIYPARTVEAEPDRHYRVLLDSSQVQRIYLEEWARQPATLAQWLIQLLLAKPSQTPAVIQAILTPTLDLAIKPTILELIETILVYKLPTLSHREIQTMLGVTHQDLKKTRFYQEIFAEGETEGELKGKLKGKLEGKLEGKIEGKLEGELGLITRQLQRRFGLLPGAVQAQLGQLDLSRLDALGEALLDFQSLAEVEQWLSQVEG